MMRNRFDEQLEELNRELILMGAMCEEAIALSVHSALDEEPEGRRESDRPAEKVAELEINIDRQEREIESLCMRLLLRQQPVAGDLRIISAALKMISDMERIGDQAADIAEMSDFIRRGGAGHRVHLRQMAREAVKMVTDSVDSFVHRDVDAARAVIAYDDVVDALFDKIKGELVGLIAEDSKNGETYLDLLMAAKYFERIGDHATNIAEWVEYSVTGKHGNEAEFNI
jgi:phosphate transport system protein